MQARSDAEVIAASLVDPAAFAALFDRHAAALRRYLVRRIGPDEAGEALGELFRIAFEKRSNFDIARPEARPWLYGIATNLVARHRRQEARRLHAVARLQARRSVTGTGTPGFDAVAEPVVEAVDAEVRWRQVADAITDLPEVERDTLLLHAWEGLTYEDVADALGIPVGTVRSRLNRARGRLRELVATAGEQPVGDDPSVELRPDRIEPDDPEDPAVLTRAKERFMSTVDETDQVAVSLPTPDVYPRLAYRDELAAVEHLTRVFQFVEHREARQEHDGNFLCWLSMGTGIVMLGHANAEVHRIHSPMESGLTTVIMHVYVHDVDAHHAHAVAEGADVTTGLRDAFYGERNYEATDPEGHRWHFAERFDDIVARGGRVDRDDPC